MVNSLSHPVDYNQDHRRVWVDMLLLAGMSFAVIWAAISLDPNATPERRKTYGRITNAIILSLFIMIAVEMGTQFWQIHKASSYEPKPIHIECEGNLRPYYQDTPYAVCGI